MSYHKYTINVIIVGSRDWGQTTDILSFGIMVEIYLSEINQDINHFKYFVLTNTAKNKYREKCLLSRTIEQKKRIYK